MMDKTFKGEKAFLSNMYKTNIQYKLNGEIYNFPSVENAYQAMKYTDKNIWHLFEKINPYEAKKQGKNNQIRDNWDDIKLNIMQKLVHMKFNQHPELMEQLLKCELPLMEGNTWNDTYWGICKGQGTNYLGGILTAEAVQEKIKRVTVEYSYKKLPFDKSIDMRQLYFENLPDFFRNNENKDIQLHDIKGNLIANKWNRVVIGDYGAFVEINDEDIIKDNIECKPGEEYRIYDEKYKNHIKYQWYVVKGQTYPKLYYQQKGVTYADYQPNKWYISPYECQEGLSITSKNEKIIYNKSNKKYQDINYNNDIIIFDTETTGTYNTDEILQISIYDITGKSIYDTYIKPYNKKEWKDAEAVNHISPDMVKNAPYAYEIAPIINDIFNNAKKIVGHNVNFDVRMVKNNFAIFIPNDKLYDTMKVFKQQYPGREHYKLIDAVNVYCPEILEQYNENAHNSSVDTYATAMVYNQQIQKTKDDIVFMEERE